MKRKYYFHHVVGIMVIVVFVMLGLASGASTPAANPESQAKSQQEQQPQKDQPQQSQQQIPINWTGDGGKGTSIAILAPQASGLEEKQGYLPALVQGEFVNNFSGYSAISVLDRQRLDEQYAELLSGYYDDHAEAGLDLGRLTPTTHIMGGNITRTATGYVLQMHVTKTADKLTAASYSGTFTFAELDNLTGIRRASLDLLKKMGVTLTAQAQGELSGAAMDSHVNAQTALARGITAQRQGTEVAALSYYFQAAAYDPSLLEAVNRSSILNANISSGNIGDNVRNDIQWRRDWVARLTETEQFFDSFNRVESMPYTLFYVSDEIKQGTINYQNETVDLSIDTYLYGSAVWTISIERALQAVWDGLNATGRKDAWQLADWPRRGVTNLNAFARRSNNFAVVFELLNDQKKVIGRQTLQTQGSWGLNWSGRPVVEISAPDKNTMNIRNVNANELTDRMTIQITNVNGTAADIAARNGLLQIRAITKNEVSSNNRYNFVRGEIKNFKNESPIVTELVIPNTIWGDPVISIAKEAFKNVGLTNVTIPISVTSIGKEAFYNNPLQNANVSANITNIIDAGLYTCKLGDIGPASGFIFYDKGSYSNGWRYLEVAPADIEFTAPWFASTYYVYLAGTKKEVGSGKSNTKYIVEQLGKEAQAALKCSLLNFNGFTDWYLPSIDELKLIYTNIYKNGLGNFMHTRNSYYCSSSQININNVWTLRFNDGQQMPQNMRSPIIVRAIRTF